MLSFIYCWRTCDSFFSPYVEGSLVIKACGFLTSPVISYLFPLSGFDEVSCVCKTNLTKEKRFTEKFEEQRRRQIPFRKCLISALELTQCWLSRGVGLCGAFSQSSNETNTTD